MNNLNRFFNILLGLVLAAIVGGFFMATLLLNNSDF